MRYAKMLGLAALAVTAAMAFVGVTSALAASPEYVLESGVKFPIGFKSTSGLGALVNAQGEKITCESDTNEGKIENSTDDEVTILFHGCKSSILSCTSAGQETGQIKVGPLKSKLVYGVDESKKVVSDLLYKGTFPPAKPGPESEVIATFTCGFTTIETRGSVLGSFVKLNEFVHENELVFIQISGEQQSGHEFEWEGKLRQAYLESKIGSGVWCQTGLETSDKVTFEGTRTVKIAG